MWYNWEIAISIFHMRKLKDGENPSEKLSNKELDTLNGESREIVETVEDDVNLTRLKLKIANSRTIELDEAIELIRMGEYEFLLLLRDKNDDLGETGVMANFDGDEFADKLKNVDFMFPDRFVEGLFLKEKAPILDEYIDKIPVKFDEQMVRNGLLRRPWLVFERSPQIDRLAVAEYMASNDPYTFLKNFEAFKLNKDELTRVIGMSLNHSAGRFAIFQDIEKFNQYIDWKKATDKLNGDGYEAEDFARDIVKNIDKISIDTELRTKMFAIIMERWPMIILGNLEVSKNFVDNYKLLNHLIDTTYAFSQIGVEFLGKLDLTPEQKQLAGRKMIEKWPVEMMREFDSLKDFIDTSLLIEALLVVHDDYYKHEKAKSLAIGVHKLGLTAQEMTVVTERMAKDYPDLVFENFETFKNFINHYLLANLFLEKIYNLNDYWIEYLQKLTLNPEEKLSIGRTLMTKWFSDVLRNSKRLHGFINTLDLAKKAIQQMYKFEEYDAGILNALDLSSEDKLEAGNDLVKLFPEQSVRFYDILKDFFDPFDLASKAISYVTSIDSQLIENIGKLGLSPEQKRALGKIIIGKSAYNVVQNFGIYRDFVEVDELLKVVMNDQWAVEAMAKAGNPLGLSAVKIGEVANELLERWPIILVQNYQNFKDYIDVLVVIKKMIGNKYHVGILATNVGNLALSEGQMRDLSAKMLEEYPVLVLESFGSFKDFVDKIELVNKCTADWGSAAILANKIGELGLTEDQLPEVWDKIARVSKGNFVVDNCDYLTTVSVEMIVGCVVREDITKSPKCLEFLARCPEMDFINNCHLGNVLCLLAAYSKLELDHSGDEAARAAIKKAVDDNKDLILTKLTMLRDQILPAPKKGTDGYVGNAGGDIHSLDKKMIKSVFEQGVEYYGLIEKNVNFIQFLLVAATKNDQSLPSLLQVVLGKMAKYRYVDEKETRYKTVDYRETDLADFYEKIFALKEAPITILQAFAALERDTQNFKTMQNDVMMKAIIFMKMNGVRSEAFAQFNNKLLADFVEELSKNKNAVKQKEIIAKFSGDISRILEECFERTLGLKNLPEFNEKMTTSLMVHLLYLTNIANKDEQKQNLIVFFLLMHLTGQWDKFKAGEAVEYKQYVTDEIANHMERYLNERETLDVFIGATEGLEEKWFKALAEDSEAQHNGDSRGVIDTISMLQNAYSQSLLDEDAFADIEDDEQKKKVRGEIDYFGKKLEEMDLGREVEELETLLIPSQDVLKIFEKVGEKMSTDSGVKPLNEDISYLRGLLLKYTDKTSEDERKIIHEYLDKIDLKIKGIYRKMDELKKSLVATSNNVGRLTNSDSSIKKRIVEYEKLFETSKDTQEILKSTMTGDIESVIPEIRQCLGCTSTECNNDTNLTFGDRNRFLVLTRRSGQEEHSVSDQLVTLLKTQDGQDSGYSFVMDNVYAHTVRATLISNVMAVIKKLEVLKDINPQIQLDVFISQVALDACRVDLQYLKESLQKEGIKMFARETNKEIIIPRSAGGHSHFEIGGGVNGRVYDETKVKIRGVALRLS